MALPPSASGTGLWTTGRPSNGGRHARCGFGVQADYRRAGLDIELTADSLQRLPAGIGLSIYHVVREALTNALKHAPGSSGAGYASDAPHPRLRSKSATAPPPLAPSRRPPAATG